MEIVKHDAIIECKTTYKDMPLEMSYKTNKFDVYNIYNESIYEFCDTVNEAFMIYKKFFAFISENLPKESFEPLMEEILDLCEKNGYEIRIFTFDWENYKKEARKDIHMVEIYKGRKKLVKCKKSRAYIPSDYIDFKEYSEWRKNFFENRLNLLDKKEEV